VLCGCVAQRLNHARRTCVRCASTAISYSPRSAVRCGLAWRGGAGRGGAGRGAAGARRGGGGAGRCYLDLPDDELHAPDERDCDLALLLNHASALPLHRIAGLPRGQRVGGRVAGAAGVAGAGDDEGVPLLSATHTGGAGRTKVRRMYCWIFRAALLSLRTLTCAGSSGAQANQGAGAGGGAKGVQRGAAGAELAMPMQRAVGRFGAGTLCSGR